MRKQKAIESFKIKTVASLRMKAGIEARRAIFKIYDSKPAEQKFINTHVPTSL